MTPREADQREPGRVDGEVPAVLWNGHAGGLLRWRRLSNGTWEVSDGREGWRDGCAGNLAEAVFRDYSAKLASRDRQLAEVTEELRDARQAIRSLYETADQIVADAERILTKADPARQGIASGRRGLRRLLRSPAVQIARGWYNGKSASGTTAAGAAGRE